MSVLLDAGPALNFLAVGQQNVLLQTAQQAGLQLTVPERVDREVDGMCKDARFKRTSAAGTWTKLKAGGHVAILADDLTTTSFAAAVARISGVPARQRVKTRKSLGEILVLAHASVLAQAGTDVFVLIDEQDGRNRGTREQDWLKRTGAPGQLRMWRTRQVLKNANATWFVGGLTWEQVYNRMRPFDDGLPAL